MNILPWRLLSDKSDQRHAGSASSAAQRGFTLIELVAVVIIIGVFAALAVPEITKRMRDRRVHETAQRIMQLYRQSRMLALGRGGAVMVRYSNEGNDQGTFDVLEGRMGDGDCTVMPNPSCSDVDWSDLAEKHDDPNGDARVATTLELGTGDGFDNVYAVMNDVPDAPDETPKHYEICYTPLGRTFYRLAETDAWAPLMGVPTVDLYRTTGSADDERIGLTRQVVLLPSGGAVLGASRLE